MSFVPRFKGVSCGYRNRNEAAVFDIVEVGGFPGTGTASSRPMDTFAFTPDYAGGPEDSQIATTTLNIHNTTIRPKDTESPRYFFATLALSTSTLRCRYRFVHCRILNLPRPGLAKYLKPLASRLPRPSKSRLLYLRGSQ